MINRILLLVAAQLLALAGTGWGQGFIIPVDNLTAIPKLISQQVAIDVKDQLSTVQVEQEFYNPTKSVIEGIYYFPLPGDAAVSNFSLSVNGGVLTGELLEKEEATRLYDEIVRKNIDPALLEMIGHKFYRVKIFPLQPGERRRLSLAYNQVLRSHDGLVKMVHPLRGNFQSRIATPLWLAEQNGNQEQLAASDFDQEITVKINASGGLKNIYSPTHKIEVVRKTDDFARIRYHGQPTSSNASDFILYYGLNDSDFGLNLLTNRATDNDGYFMMLLSPKVKVPHHEILDKDLIFVLDISASMVGDKLVQAKEALKFCINSLGSNDHFNIIVFSTEAKLFKQELVNAAKFKYEAVDFINRIEAKGGTNINEALLTALDIKGGQSHSPKIVFVTDGLPTVGVKDADEIRRNVKRVNKEKYRIFTFGVGYDVNTQLLDGIAQDGRAVADYIEPDDDIETAISAFYSKISDPVLSGLKIDFGGVEVTDVYPKELPDLFKGSQLTIVGKYKNPATTEITVSGQVNNSKSSFKYNVDFPQRSPEPPQLPQLWATRKIGFLLEQIKLNADQRETKDLIADVVDLSKRYGIVTPYTSYFIHEGEFPQVSRAHETYNPNDQVQFSALTSNVGKQAVSYSKNSRRLQEAETLDTEESPRIRYVGGRSFWKDSHEYWLDLEFKDNDAVLHIQYGSEAYFILLKQYPAVSAYLSLGTKVVFRFMNRFVKIDDQGSAQLTSAGIKTFFENN
jgi:Ca-activated chloride channel family protein